MHRHAVDGGGVDHHGQRTSEGSGLEGFEILLTQHQRREVGRGTVLTRPRGAIGEVVLRAGTHVETVDVVVILALIALDLCSHHLRVDDGILAKALVDTRPTRVTAQVDDRVIHPRTVGSTTLVGRDLCANACQFGVESRTQVDGLWEERATCRIGDAMVVVEAVDIRDAQILHRLLLNQTDPLLPLFHAGSTGARGVEDRTHLPLRDQRVEHRLVELPHTLGIALVDIDRESTQLVDDLLIGHLQHGGDLLVGATILLQYRTHLLTVDLGVLNGHLTHHVEVQLKHLADLLVECHTGKGLLNLRFQFRITRDSRLR